MSNEYNEVMQQWYKWTADKLPPLLAEEEILRKAIAEATAIVEADNARSKTQAWKRRMDVITPQAATSVTDAKSKLKKYAQDLSGLESRIGDVKNQIAANEMRQQEDEEVDAWSHNLKLPRNEREDLPTPKKIQRMDAREKADRQAMGGWVRLKLVKTPADLATNVATLMARKRRVTTLVQSFADEEDSEDDAQEEESDEELETHAEYLANCESTY